MIWHDGQERPTYERKKPGDDEPGCFVAERIILDRLSVKSVEVRALESLSIHGATPSISGMWWGCQPPPIPLNPSQLPN